ncbi:MAG: helix-turn-helix transcriptional regulator [Oligoflexus sp.]|nr:helix-turn-helix transcriptional regulator [Oligoflexus sp.]
MPHSNSALEEIGAAVRNARRRLGLNQETVAGLTNVGRRFISELESGKKPTLEIGKVLQVTASLGLQFRLHERYKG